MGQPIQIFAGTTGLNTKLDPARIAGPGETGVVSILAAVNVTVDLSGRVDRCKGYSQITTGRFRDLFCDGGQALVVRNDVLCALSADWSLRALRAVTPGLRVSYIQTTIRNRVYWSNGVEAGYVEDGLDYDWVAETYVGPDSDRVFADTPPRGHLLEWMAGRIYVANDNTVWISERFFPGVFWLHGRHIRRPSRIRLLAAVADGIWVGDESGIYWVRGLDPTEQVMVKKVDDRVIEGTTVKVEAGLLPYENLVAAGGRAIKVWTTDGLVILGTSGFFFNETRDILETQKPPFPLAVRQGASLVWEDKMMTTFEP